MICTNCLSEVPADARFCTECGHPVSASKGVKTAESGVWWKWALGVSGAVIVAWAVTEWVPDTEPAQSPDTELPQALDPAPPEPAPPASEQPTPIDGPPEAAPEAAQTPDTGDWQLRTEVSAFDDTKAIYLELPADQLLWDASMPLLTLRCKENSWQAYVFGISPKADRESELATARLRFDKTEVRTLKMVRAVGDDALFFRRPIEIIRTMMNHGQLLFRFTTADSDRLTATFNLRGLSKALEPLREECDWE